MRAGTGVVVAMIPALLDHVAVGTLVLIAVAKDDASLLKTCVNGTGGVVPVIPEMAAYVNTSVVDSLVAENEVLLLELAANTDVEGLVPSAVLADAVSAIVEGSEGSVFDMLAVLEVDGDEIGADELPDLVRAVVRAGTSFVVAKIPVLLDHVDASTLVPIAVDKNDALSPKACVNGARRAVSGIPEMPANVNTPVATPCVAEHKVLPPDAGSTDVEGLVPSAVLMNAVSATIEGSEGSVFSAPAVLEMDGDKLLDSAWSAVLVGAGPGVAMTSVVISRAGACEQAPAAVADADGDASLLTTHADGVGETVPGILVVPARDNTRVAAARVIENDGLRLDDTAHSSVAVLVPPAELVNAALVTVEGSGVPEFAARTALAVFEVEGDELLEPAEAEVRAGTGAAVAMIPVLLDQVDVDVSTLVPSIAAKSTSAHSCRCQGVDAVQSAAAKEDASMLKTCVHGVGGAVPVTLEMAADVSTSVVASRVAENEALLLKAATITNTEVPVPSAVLANAISVTIEGSEGSASVPLAVLEGDGEELLGVEADELLDPAGAEMRVGTKNEGRLLEAAANADLEGLLSVEALVNAVSATIEGSVGQALAMPAMLGVDGDRLTHSAGAAVRVGAGSGVAMIPVVIDQADTCRRVPTAVADADNYASPLKSLAGGERVPEILDALGHAITWVAAARVEECDVLRLDAAATVNVEVLVPPAVLLNADSDTVESSGVPEFAVPAVLVVLVVEVVELLEPARAEVRAGTGETVPVIPDMTADVNTSVLASRVAENELLLLDAAADADMEGLVPSALLVNATSATTEW